MTKPRKTTGFVRTTAIGGLLFLLPLIVVGALIGQVVPIVMTIAEALKKILPGFFQQTGGIALLILLSIVVLLLICFAAGVIARNSLSRKVSAVFEKHLTMLFPKYAILKDQMADSIGGEQTRPQMKPVSVRFDDQTRIGFETQRSENSEMVAVYLPGSPDAWIGHVALVNSDRVESINAHFGEAVTCCEQLGRGSFELVANSLRSEKPQS